MVDVLQQLLTSAAANGVFEHPINPDAPCRVLHYADDMLIILKADENQLLALKETLQVFSTATGLHINFEKSTFLPICVDPNHASHRTSPPFLNAQFPPSCSPTLAYPYPPPSSAPGISCP